MTHRVASQIARDAMKELEDRSLVLISQVSVAGIPKNRCRTTVAERMGETRAEEKLEAADERLLRRRAELIRWLLRRGRSPSPPRPRNGRSTRVPFLWFWRLLVVASALGENTAFRAPCDKNRVWDRAACVNCVRIVCRIGVGLEWSPVT
jgi:hypothetical protein